MNAIVDTAVFVLTLYQTLVLRVECVERVPSKTVLGPMMAPMNSEVNRKYVIIDIFFRDGQSN